MAQVSERPRRAPGAGRPKLVLIGFMGSGKSHAASRLAQRMGVEPLDSDHLIEERAGKPISAIFESEGEGTFRELEEALVLELLDRDDAEVVALGGGALKSRDVMMRLDDHVCVYLEVNPDLAWDRAQKSARPLARDRDQFLALHAERTPLYESVARAIVPVDDGLVDEALDATALLAVQDLPHVRMIWAPVAGGGYPVYAGRDVLDALDALWPSDGRCFAVADEEAWKLYGERLERALSAGPGLESAMQVPSGERSKSLAQCERILRELAGAGMERSDTLVALGGGVAGDVAGFCAAVYQRGVPVVQVPTTLMAQVDSAYGGKTGVDLPEAKNYVGAFHQPVAVFTDPQLLSTLPAAELRAGFAEVVKTALIAGEPLWDAVQRLEPIERAPEADPEAVSAVIESCLRTKLRVVALDERDLGVRAVLNLGHTFAHALEAAGEYSGYRHGEAVAIGLLVALRLSEQELGLDPAVRGTVGALLRSHGLPGTFEGPATDEVLARMALDKKRRRGRGNFVLLRAPGDVVTGCEVDDSSLKAAVDEVRGG